MNKGLKYYYHRLDKTGREIYDCLLAGFDALAPAIRVPMPDDPRGFGDIFFQLRLDNPEIFFVTGYGYRKTPDALYAEFLPQYMFDRQKVREHRQAIDSRLQKLLRPAAGLSEAEKEKYIHDFICQNVRYDKLKKSYSHEIIGPLQNGVGVCEGIAKTVKLMCDALGLDCLIAISEAEPDAPGGYLHAWNIIKLGGKFYHLDATFDNTLGRGETLRYDYYNLGDKSIFRDHRPLLYPAPECAAADGFYYKAAGLSWTKNEDVESRVLQALRKKKDALVFHWRGGYLTREKLLELVEIINSAAKTRDKGVSYAVNFPQAVISLRFTEPDGESTIEAENADEGSEAPFAAIDGSGEE